MLGAIIAGGRSRRMGRDKAGLDWGGRPAWAVQSDVLREAGAGPVVLVRRRDQTAPGGVPCVRDRLDGRGPLAGIEAALALAASTGARHLAVLAVDMPGADRRLFTVLKAHLRPGRGAVFRHAVAFEPLAAIYPAEAWVQARRRLLRGQWALQGWVEELVDCGLLTALGLPAGTREQVRSANGPCAGTAVPTPPGPRSRSGTGP